MADYKTGIDITFSGTEGVDYAAESLFYDPLILDRRVVYIKSATQITLSHNARNLSAESVPDTNYNAYYGPVVGENVGIIRYKIDRDLQWGRMWGDADVNRTFYTYGGGTQSIAEANNPEYSAPFSLASLTYDGSTAVVGTTGSTGTITNWGTYYWRGILDSVGDEWHVLTVADDDTAYVNYSEKRSSDGKIVLLVVNPKTPVLQISTSGNGQYYTTPAKNYFLPKIHDQTTYFSAGTGGVTFTLKDINGNNVYYRINGGSWSAGAATVTLTAADFTTGSNTLEYYYAGNQAYTKTRTVVKDPAYPSAGETHGNRMWGEGNWEDVAARLEREPYATNLSNYYGNNNQQNKLNLFDTYYHTGTRNCFGQSSLGNAIVAKFRGYEVNADGKSVTNAQYAKRMLLDSELTIDPVGFEINHSLRSIPARDLWYRGYYDSRPVMAMALAYDILIGDYKSTQFTGGITAVEDYMIRDGLASMAMFSLLTCGNYNGQEFTDTGMWGTTRNIQGAVIALMMPSYSTPYLGTSGVDGSTTTAAWVPYPDYPLTWKQALIDQNTTLRGYPNYNYRLGVEEALFTADYKFTDKAEYFEDNKVGGCVALGLSLIKRYFPSTSFPRADEAFSLCANNLLYGTDDMGGGNYGPVQYPQTLSCNASFPDSATDSIANVQAQSNPGYWIYATNGFAFGFYNDEYVGQETVETPTFNPSAGSHVGTQSVTISTTTAGASIRYTVDGSTPTSTSGTVYSGAISVTSSLTLKAIAYKAGMTDSSVASAAYTITAAPLAIISLSVTTLQFA